MISKDWQALPMWTAPLEALTPEAIAVMCDADRRPRESMDTLVVRLNSLPCPGGKN